MELDKIVWNKNSYNEFIKYLYSLSDKEYKKFSSKITITNLKIIGIRVPILRNISKKILKTNVEDYFKLVNNKLYEEVFIYGLVLANSSEDLISIY